MTTTTTITEAAANLVVALRTWATVEHPIIGYRLSATTAVRDAAARDMQRDASEWADRIAAMSEDELEACFVQHYTLRNAIVNMDAHDQVGIRFAAQACFDAAIARRDEREGLRRDALGWRQRKNAAGHWEYC